MNGDDPDRRIESGEWFRTKETEDAQFPAKTVRSDEATFKVNSIGNRHSSACCSESNPHIDVEKIANVPGVTLAWFAWTILL